MTFKRFILLSVHYFSEQSSWDNIAYMVFQKIEHDVERWRKMDEERQELWIGRSKATGLLLGTIPRMKTVSLQMIHTTISSCNNQQRKNGRSYTIQKDHERKFFDPGQILFKGIRLYQLA